MPFCRYWEDGGGAGQETTDFRQSLVRASGFSGVTMMIMHAVAARVDALFEPAKGLFFGVVIVYEDDVTLGRATVLWQCLRKRLEREIELHPERVHVDGLKDADLAHRAARDAVTAGPILFSFHAGNQLPPQVMAWINEWLPQKPVESGAMAALVGLPADELKGVTPIHTSLHDTAFHRRLEFLSQVVSGSGKIETFEGDMLLDSLPIGSDGTAAAMHAITVPSHWGINE